MQVVTKLLALILFWILIPHTGIQPSEAQTTSQKQWQNERPPAYRLPRISRDGPLSFISESRAE